MKIYSHKSGLPLKCSLTLRWILFETYLTYILLKFNKFKLDLLVLTAKFLIKKRENHKLATCKFSNGVESSEQSTNFQCGGIHVIFPVHGSNRNCALNLKAYITCFSRKIKGASRE